MYVFHGACTLRHMPEDLPIPDPYSRHVPVRDAIKMMVPTPPVFTNLTELTLYIDELSELIAYCRYVVHSTGGMSGEENFKAEWRLTKNVAEHEFSVIPYALAQARALEKLQDEVVRVYAERFLNRPIWRCVLRHWWWRITNKETNHPVPAVLPPPPP